MVARKNMTWTFDLLVTWPRQRAVTYTWLTKTEVTYNCGNSTKISFSLTSYFDSQTWICGCHLRSELFFSDEATVKDQSRYMYFFCIKPSKWATGTGKLCRTPSHPQAVTCWSDLVWSRLVGSCAIWSGMRGSQDDLRDLMDPLIIREAASSKWSKFLGSKNLSQTFFKHCQSLFEWAKNNYFPFPQI